MDIVGRLEVGVVTHKGFELECYIPQISINGSAWYDVLDNKSEYILRMTFDPVRRCDRCDGAGCNECRGGFRKGASVDTKEWAQSILDIEIRKIRAQLSSSEAGMNAMRYKIDETEESFFEKLFSVVKKEPKTSNFRK